MTMMSTISIALLSDYYSARALYTVIDKILRKRRILMSPEQINSLQQIMFDLHGLC